MHQKSDEVNNKLIVLYILNKIDMPINHMQLMKIILENRFMNYFTFQEIIKELVEAAFISILSENDTNSYKITESGLNSLNFFEGRIPLGIKKYLDNNSSFLKSRVKADSLIQTNILEENDEFVVNCSVSENDFSLIDIKLTVGTRSDAQLICNNWRKNSEQIYSEFIESLIKKR
jgi:predicted transcriptional regulator